MSLHASSKHKRRWQGLKVAVQWAWIAAVVGFCIVAGRRHWDSLDFSTVELSPMAIASGFALIGVGKVLMGLASMRVYTLSVGKDRLFAFLAYHLSQLGKYVPGSVWQHVSRAYMYHTRGVGKGAIAQAIAMESAWILVTSLGVGALILALAEPAFFYEALGLLGLQPESTVLAAAVAILALVGALLLLLRRHPASRSLVSSVLRADAGLIALLTLMWIAFGMSLAVLLPGTFPTAQSVAYLTGLFALAYGLGFVVVFAPAGLGIREAVLAAGLAPFIDIGPSLVIIAVHRLLYLANDVACFALAHVVQVRWAKAATQEVSEL